MTRLQKAVIFALAAIGLAGAGATVLGARPSTGPCIGPTDAAQISTSAAFTPYRSIAADGNCLQAYEWKPANGPIRAAVVVILGIHDHARRYDRLARALNAAGVAVYAQDHRGHSTSGGARQRIDSIAQLVQDTDLAVTEATRRNPGVPVFLHGHSMGGLVAAHYAIDRARLPGRELAGVVVSSAALKLPAAASGGTRAVVGLLSVLAPNLGIEAVDEANLVRAEAARAVLAADPVLIREKVPARTVATILGGIVDIQQRMDQLALPVLILHGSADRVTESEGSRDLAKRAAHRDKTLRIYEGARHDLLHEPEGTDVILEIVGFIVGRLR